MDECQFSYPRFHVYFSIPATTLLYLLNRPFLTRLDRAKLILLPCIAFVWTTPWDNELVRQRAWRYPRSCVIGTIGFVPVEEYFFVSSNGRSVSIIQGFLILDFITLPRAQFIIQSVMTTLLAIFTTRWLLPTFYVFRAPKEQPTTALAVAACITAFTTGVLLTRPGEHSYYMGMILWWAAIPLCLLFWGTAGFVSRMQFKTGKVAFALTLAIPTAYLWACDLFALKRGTWHINESTSFNVFPIPHLPVEEMVFFLLTNLLLVIASFTFDRCIALGRLGIGIRQKKGSTSAGATSSHSPPYSPSYLPLNVSTIQALWRTFVTQDPPATPTETRSCPHSTPQRQVADLQASLRILSRASRSFSLASLLFPWDLRSDLSMLYAFCRAADDFVDEPLAAAADGVETKSSRMALLHRLVDAVYLDGKSGGGSDEDARVAIRSVLSAYRHSRPSAIEELRASASSVVSLRHLVPRSLWLELLRGYERDVRLDMQGYEARFQTMDELIDYAQCVAGCVGEMCVRVVLGRCGQPLPHDSQPVDLRIPVSFDRICNQWLTDDADGDTGLTTADDKTSTSTSLQLLFNARRMGVALQLVNIARDVVEDSLHLKRCYLPEEFLANTYDTKAGHAGNDEAVALLRTLFSGTIDLRGSTDSKRLTPHHLRSPVLHLLDLSSHLYHFSLPSLAYFSQISRPVQSGLRAACEVYFAIGDGIRYQSDDDIRVGRRARLSKTKRIVKALRSVYGI